MTICWSLKLNGNYNTSQFKDFKKSLKIPMGVIRIRKSKRTDNTMAKR